MPWKLEAVGMRSQVILLGAYPRLRKRPDHLSKRAFVLAQVAGDYSVVARGAAGVHTEQATSFMLLSV